MMKKAGLVLVMAFFFFAAAMSGQQCYREYNEYVLSTPQGEVKVIEEIGTPSVGVSVDDLLQMVFHADEIPNYYYTGTLVHLNLGGLFSRLDRGWLHEEHKIRGAKSPFYHVSIDLFIYADVEKARKFFYSYTRSGAMSAQEGSFSGIPIGEECGHYFPLSETKFRVGRVIAHVSATLPDATSPEDHTYFTEALCIGLDYLLRQHPKVGVITSKMRLLLAGQPDGEVVLLRDVAFGTPRLLKGVGIQVKEHRDGKEWGVRLARSGRWVKVKAFSWDMETEKGKVKLERPVFPYKGDLIVPLRQVAEALGIAVQQKGQTITLMPK